MLGNITTEAVQFTNRNPYASPYSVSMSCHSESHQFSSDVASPQLSLPRNGVPSLTPYAPATSIPRYFNNTGVSTAAMSSSMSPQFSAPIETIPFTSSRSGSVTALTSAPAVMVSANTTPASTTAPAIHPVYAPSVPTVHPLFVDVYAGAPTTPEDDTILLRNGYIAPVPSVNPPSFSTIPQVIVGRASAPSPAAADVAVASPPAASQAPAAITVAELEESLCQNRVSVRVGSTQEKNPVRPTAAVASATTPVIAASLVAAEVTPARSTRRSSQQSKDSPSVTTQTPTSASKNGSSKKGAQVATPAATTAAATSESPSAAAPYHVDVRGHRNRSMQVASTSWFAEGTHVVFEGDRGLDLGVVHRITATADKCKDGHATDSDALPMIIRVATADEIRTWSEELPALAAEALHECSQLILAMHLRMRLVDASYQLDRQKLTLYYETSENRVDFRKLLMELFNRYRCRIWFEKVEKVVA